MNRHFTLGHRLPSRLAVPLFGDRRRYGAVIRTDDPSWQEWERRMPQVYDATQRTSVGRVVNDAGYGVLSHVEMEGREVLEVGPGSLDHLDHCRGRPRRYVLADVRPEMLKRGSERLRMAGVPHAAVLLPRSGAPCLPFPEGAFDLVIAFYSLEHLYPLEDHLAELRRTLCSGGLLVGAIPCEGGLAWGCGRFLTTRRWFKRHTTIDPDKIICWEHPNFADRILTMLDRTLIHRHLQYWPLRIPSLDLNLVVRFVYEKP